LSTSASVAWLRMPGHVMLVKRCQAEAPSTSAASYRLPGIDCIAANNVSVKKG
jgi:hypothetical protein